MTVADLARAIEEAADIEDGETVFIDDLGPGVHVGVGSRGIEITFPTTVHEVLALAAEAERLNAEEDATFRIIAGDPDSSVIIHVPHSSREIPDDVRSDIVLDDEALEHELDAMTDAFTDVIAEHAAAASGKRPWLFVNEQSRLVVDPERFPDESEEMNAVGMGVVYTRTSTGEPLRETDAYDEDGLISRYFEPYAAAFADLVDERLAAIGSVTILDLHSFPLNALPYELHGDGTRPQICLGTDAFHTSKILLAEALHAFSGFERATDSPFSGCYVPLVHYGKSSLVNALMVELRRDLYMDEHFQLVEPATTPIVEAIVKLIAAIEPSSFMPAGLAGGYFNCVIAEDQ
ncbi:N-formylglutamate amidohydrolase [Aeromicrobium sp. YC3-14]|nr:N-formylglutamate amidohydrolase [Aeromicrobium stalagmiti]